MFFCCFSDFVALAISLVVLAHLKLEQLNNKKLKKIENIDIFFYCYFIANFQNCSIFGLFAVFLIQRNRV